MNVPPPPKGKRSTLGLQTIGALGIAVIGPGLWSPFILISGGLIVAAFVMSIILIVRGKPIRGALGIAACPFAAFMAFSMIGVQDEVKKQQRAREPQERSAYVRGPEATPSPSMAPVWIRLTLDIDVSKPTGETVSLKAGWKLKALEKRGYDYLVEYEGGRYLVPTAITKVD